MSIFRENIVAEYWFEQQSALGDENWSELYSLYEHMRDHVGLPYQAMRTILEETRDLMLLGKWNGISE